MSYLKFRLDNLKSLSFRSLVFTLQWWKESAYYRSLIPISRYSESVSLGDAGISIYHSGSVSVWCKYSTDCTWETLLCRFTKLNIMASFYHRSSIFFLQFLEHILFPFSFLKSTTYIWAKSRPRCKREKYSLCETLSKCSNLVVFQEGVCT